MKLLRSWIAAVVGFVGRLVGRLTMVLSTRRYGQSGRWEGVFGLPNVAIHTTLLPDGKVLFWGRRDEPGGSMNEHSGTPHVVGPGLPVHGLDAPAAAGRRHHGQPVLRRARLPPRRAAARGGRPPHRRRRHRLRGHLRPPQQHLDAAARHERRTLVPHRHLARRRPGAGDLGQRGGARHDRGERRPADHRRRGLGAHRRLRRAAALPAHARRPGRAGPHGGLQRHDLPARHPRRRRLDPARRPGERIPGVRARPRCTRPAR